MLKKVKKTNTWKGTVRQQGGKECGTKGQCTQPKMSGTHSQSKGALQGWSLYLLETALASSWSWAPEEWPAMLTGSYKYSSWIQLMSSPLEVLLSKKEKNDILPKHAKNNYKEKEKKCILTGFWSMYNYLQTVPEENVPSNFHNLNFGVWLYLITQPSACKVHACCVTHRWHGLCERRHTTHCQGRPVYCEAGSSQITILWQVMINTHAIFSYIFGCEALMAEPSPSALMLLSQTVKTKPKTVPALHQPYKTTFVACVLQSSY